MLSSREANEGQFCNRWFFAHHSHLLRLPVLPSLVEKNFKEIKHIHSTTSPEYQKFDHEVINFAILAKASVKILTMHVCLWERPVRIDTYSLYNRPLKNNTRTPDQRVVNSKILVATSLFIKIMYICLVCLLNVPWVMLFTNYISFKKLVKIGWKKILKCTNVPARCTKPWDGQNRIAIGYLSDKGVLKIECIKATCETLIYSWKTRRIELINMVKDVMQLKILQTLHCVFLREMQNQNCMYKVIIILPYLKATIRVNVSEARRDNKFEVATVHIF